MGRSATSLSEIATMVTEADVASGSINHALSINISDCNGWVLPATRGDCGSDPGQPAEGQWFRFAPGTTCNPTTQCTTPFAPGGRHYPIESDSPTADQGHETT